MVAPRCCEAMHALRGVRRLDGLYDASSGPTRDDAWRCHTDADPIEALRGVPPRQNNPLLPIDPMAQRG